MNTSDATSNLSRVYSVAELIGVAAPAMERCGASGNAEWCGRWGNILDNLFSSVMPRGSGFDAGTKMVRASDREIVVSTAFHHMNDGGYYDGWTEHTVRIRATFDGFSMTVSGRDRNSIKDYIAEVFHIAFSTPVRFDADGNIHVEPTK